MTMIYKILETHIVFNHPHGDYVVSVAIESSPNYWKAYYLQVKEISISSLIEVARCGEKLSKHRAFEIFGSCRNLEKQKRLIYEG